MSVTSKANGGEIPWTDHAHQLKQFAFSVAAESMFTLSPSARILDVNEATCQRLEYTREELTRMTVADIDPLVPLESWPRQFDEVRRNGQIRLETKHRTKSGRLFDVEVSAAYFQFGGEEYLCASARDITQRKRAEQIIQLQHDVLKMIASAAGLQETLDELCKLVEELAPDSLVTVMRLDAGDRCLRFEAGPGLTDKVRAAFEPLCIGATAGSCGSAAHYKMPIYVEDTRCSQYWANLQHIVSEFNLLACWSVPILDEHGNVLGTFAISHGQTGAPDPFQEQLLATASHLASIAMERQRFEESLRVAHDKLAHISRVNMMGELASSLAHELNQPLTAIANYAFALENDMQNSEGSSAMRSHAGNLREQALRAGDIISSVRSMAKQKSPDRRLVDLNTVVEKSLAMLNHEFRKTGVDLVRELALGLPKVEADEVQIQQVIVNLIHNAADAVQDQVRDRRWIKVITETDGGHCVALRVEDSGRGLSAEDCSLVFEPFHTTKSEGMGMGLSICQSIAKRHDGRLIAESAPGGGALFSLVLPACKIG